MNTRQGPSDYEMPSPIFNVSQKKSNTSARKEFIRDLDESQSISEKDDNQLLQSLSKIQDDENKNATQSLVIDKEWHPVQFKSGVFHDNTRIDNVNQSTEVDISAIKSSYRDKPNQKKSNPIQQPIISELEDSVYLEQASLKQSKIIRKSLNRIKENKDREWIEPNFDIFDDPDLDNSPQTSNKSKEETKNKIHINYAERKPQLDPNQFNNAELEQNIPSGLGAVLLNMISSGAKRSIENQPGQFLFPQMNHQPPPQHQQRNVMHQTFQPPQVTHDHYPNPNPMVRTQHFQSHFQQQSNRIKNIPTPRSVVDWNQNQYQAETQSVYQQKNSFPAYQIMNQLKYLRQDVKLLREQWKEQKAERLLQKLESKVNSNSDSTDIQRKRRGSDSYDKQFALSFEIKNLLQEQQRKHQRRMKEMQLLFMNKIQQLQKEQKQLKEQNLILRRKSILKHTDSREENMMIVSQFGTKSTTDLKKKSISSRIESASTKLNINDDLLKDKLSIIRKDGSPPKKPGFKRKKVESKPAKSSRKEKAEYQ